MEISKVYHRCMISSKGVGKPDQNQQGHPIGLVLSGAEFAAVETLRQIATFSRTLSYSGVPASAGEHQSEKINSDGQHRSDPLAPTHSPYEVGPRYKWPS